MAIQQTKCLWQKREDGSALRVEQWNVRCSACPAESKRVGATAGDADFYGRREGFGTVYSGNGQPGKWLCHGCSKKLVKKVFGK